MTNESLLPEPCRGGVTPRHGVDVSVGIGPSIMVAATASVWTQIPRPGGILVIDSGQTPLAWSAAA